VRISRLILLAVASVSMFALATPASAVPSVSVVVNEVQTRGDNGGNDEFIELRNISAQPVDIGGFRVLGCNATGSVTSRATIPTGTTLPAGGHYLLTNNNGANSIPPLPSYDGPVKGDQTYGLGVTDDGGVRLQNSAGAIVDQVGFSATTPCTETAPAANDSAPIDNSVTRSETAGLTVDSDVNSIDFTPSAPSPTNSSSSS